MLVWIQQFKKNKKTTALLLTCVVVFFVFFFSQTAFAQQNVESGDVFGTAQIDQNVALGNQSLVGTVVKIINIGLSLLGIVALGIVLYGGFVYMTSGGAEDKIATAKKILINGTIGLAIILSSWAITRFILAKLGEATGVSGLGGLLGGGGSEFNDFGGTGALGNGIIRDHYPTPNQKNVKRNVRIAITFNEPIDPSTIIENTNKTCWGADGKPTLNCVVDGDNVANPYYGDCITPPGQQFNWERDCDKLNTDAVGIFATSTAGVFNRTGDRLNSAPQPLPAYALTTYEDGEERNALSFVFKPVNYLGDNLKNVDYTVGISPEVKKKNGTAALKRTYPWNFQTGTSFDFDAPTISSREPASNAVIPRNQIIQVVFSEPMDPISLQGIVAPGSSFNNLIFGNQAIRGEWKLSNGYRTAEFTSTEPCGENSCGQIMYCLPAAACPAGQDPETCRTDAEILVRTAQPLANNSFEAVPLTGITDISGNALDGDADAQVDGKPNMPGDFKVIGKDGGSDERKADNAYWQFRISNSIDRTAPFIENVKPSIDEEGVGKDDPLTLSFSKPMFHATLRFIGVKEHPAPRGVDEMWYRSTAERSDEKDMVTVDHREFGPNGQDFFYFPTVSSTVKDLRQNCMYPGVGPQSNVRGQDTHCALLENGNPGPGCVAVNDQNNSDTGCAQTTSQDKAVQPDLNTCLSELRNMSNQVLPANP